MTSSENKVGLNSPVLDLHQWFVNRLSPSPHHHNRPVKAVANYARECHSCTLPARHSTASLREYCRLLRQHMDAGSRCPTAVLCHLSSSVCLTPPFICSLHNDLPFFHASVTSKLFLLKIHSDFLLFSLLQGSSLWLYSIKEPQAYHWPRSKQTATKHTKIAHLSLHTPFSLLTFSWFPSPLSCYWNTVSS